ncbi:MAG: glycosyltransferase [Bacteroidales bacterium]|nr:glycosyltransferase [Bacteroidales bacterium]
MRVLLCNKFYYRRGGDCVYTIGLESLLKANGLQVAVFAMEHPETLDTPWRRYFPSEVNLASLPSKLRFLARSLGWGETASRFKALLDEFRPDVVHLGNIHSQLSPVIAQIARAKGCKVIWTLHDYKLACPRYDCLLKGETPCEQCFRNKLNVLKNKCMKDSFAGSLMAYLEAEKWNRDRLVANTDVFICPSSFMKRKMEQAGFPSEKLVWLCNFMDVEKCRRQDCSDRGDYYCYVGRLSKEKGIATLAGVAASLPFKLLVLGDGPVRGELPLAANIEYLGRKDWAEIKDIVGHARFLVIPSEWYENNPLSVIESLCLGTPVLGADIGGIPELIEPGISGMTFKSGDPVALAEAVQAMFNADFDYKSIAEQSCRRFSQEVYYKRLLELYK